MSFVRVFIPENAIWLHDALNQLISEMGQNTDHNTSGFFSVDNNTNIVSDFHKEQFVSAFRYALYSGKITAFYVNDSGIKNIPSQIWRKEFGDFIIQYGVYIENGNHSSYKQTIEEIINIGEWAYVINDDFHNLLKEGNIMLPFGVGLFDQISSDQNTLQIVSPKNAAGRPPKYDWAKLAGYLCNYLIDMDPTESDAVRAALQWFANDPGSALSKQGLVPDKRDVERFVAEMFKAKVRKT